MGCNESRWGIVILLISLSFLIHFYVKEKEFLHFSAVY
ncbi:hypothetical protein MC28_1339 [Bacillus thuringiensis MC28]|nr:hypothetical protein MC28_1339 [Bacillus thuringiensis MC28]